ncbi:MAG: MFS transporter [Actinomycetota bacterium]
MGAIGIYGVVVGALGPTLPAIRGEFHVGTRSGGLTLMAFGAGFVLSVLVAGRVADRRGVSVVVRAGLWVMAAALAGGLWHSYWGWVAAVAIVGAAGGWLVIGANICVAEMFPDRRGAALNWLNLFFAVGALSAPVLVAWIGGGSAWRRPLLVVAATSALLGIPALGVRMPGRRVVKDEAGIRWPVANKSFVLLLILAPLYVGSELGFGSWLFPYLRSAGIASALAAVVVSLFWLMLAAGRLLVGALALRFSERALLATGAAIGSLGVVGTILIPGSAKAGAVAVAGLGFAGVFPLTLAVAARSFPTTSGSALGALLAVGGAGNVVIPWVMGAVAQAGGQGAGLAVGAGTMALVSVCAVAEGRADARARLRESKEE